MRYQGKHCRRGLGGKAFTAMLALTLVLAGRLPGLPPRSSPLPARSPSEISTSP